MFRRFSINFALLSMGLDAILVAGSLWIASHLRPFLSSLPFAATVDQNLRIPVILYPIFAFAWVAILMLLSIYDGRRNLRVTDELATLTLGVVMAAVSLAGTLYLSYREVSRLLFLGFILLTYVSMITWRLAIRVAFHSEKGWNMQQRRVLIAGAGPVGQQLYDQVKRLPFMGLTIAGFLDDDPKKLAQREDILGNLEQVRDIITQNNIQDVVVALPGRAYARASRLVAELHDLPVKVWVIPDYFHLTLHKAVVEDFAGIPMLDLRAPALTDYQRMIKRAFDLVVTILLLFPALIAMGLIALAIRLEGPGKVIFNQVRVGENGRLFKIYKFRTMVPNAEELRDEVEHLDENGNLIHKTPDDPRVTRVGRFLRQTSLDEMPQIFNILRGEMSLVGPRPELPYLVEMYEPWQHKRFAVPPGLTGWWQVNGRSDKPMHLHTEDDLYYVQNYSLLLDLQILVKTIWVVLYHRGAY
jgi:exopolysaccharide biosynthesis polyprenyl glycosylphosphotransferase